MTAFAPAPAKLITTPQVNFINDLKVGRDRSELNEVDLATLEDLEAGIFVERSLASALIDGLKAIKKESKKTPAILPGIYLCPDGTIVKVVQSRGSKNVYANAMVKIDSTRLTINDEVADWDYAYSPGLIGKIQPEWRADAATASAWGLKSGRCLWCKKELKVASSILAGLGPVCARKFV